MYKADYVRKEKLNQSEFYATALKDVSSGFRGLKIGDNMTEIKCNYSIEEVCKSFIEDVEKVKELLQIPIRGEITL